MKNISIWGLFIFLATLSSCTVGRFIVYNFADINDHKIFPTRTIEKPDNSFYFHETAEEKSIKELEIYGKSYDLDQYLEKNKTVAFLIIKNDTILYENYFKGYDKSSIVPSFSMAKSVTSILMGCAIDDGYIQSVDEPVTNYLPQLKKNGLDKVTIKHVLQMTSGIRFNESYINPFGHAATYYYGRNLRKQVDKMKLEKNPGKSYKYTSGNTQLLGAVLEAALRDKTISQYLEEKLWKPLQMEYDASWSLDKEDNGMEKTFCCLNARARDFAKIGRLYLHKGNWNGKQIVPEKWVEESTKVEESDGSAWFYQYQWWLVSRDGDYMAQGILGQYVYINPEKNMIIVRLGKDHGDANWRAVFQSLAKSY